jgi:hypothetical protein
MRSTSPGSIRRAFEQFGTSTQGKCLLLRKSPGPGSIRAPGVIRKPGAQLPDQQGQGSSHPRSSAYPVGGPIHDPLARTAANLAERSSASVSCSLPTSLGHVFLGFGESASRSVSAVRGSGVDHFDLVVSHLEHSLAFDRALWQPLGITTAPSSNPSRRVRAVVTSVGGRAPALGAQAKVRRSRTTEGVRLPPGVPRGSFYDPDGIKLAIVNAP